MWDMTHWVCVRVGACGCVHVGVCLMDFQFHFLCTRSVHQGSRWDWVFTAGSEIGLVLLDSQLHLNALKQRESGSYIKGFDMWQCDNPRLGGRLALDMLESQEHPLTAATYTSELMTRSSLRLTVWKGRATMANGLFDHWRPTVIFINYFIEIVWQVSIDLYRLTCA